MKTIAFLAIILMLVNKGELNVFSNLTDGIKATVF